MQLSLGLRSPLTLLSTLGSDCQVKSLQRQQEVSTGSCEKGTSLWQRCQIPPLEKGRDRKAKVWIWY